MTNHRSSHACILGRELINRIPVLKNGLDTTRKLVDELSLRIRGVLKIDWNKKFLSKMRMTHIFLLLNRPMNLKF